MVEATSMYRKAVAVLPIVVVVGLSVAFYFLFTPSAVIEYLGIQNAFLIMFVAAFLAGLTTFNTVPYYSVLLVLSTAGLNPVLLGLSSAAGVMCGDSVSYLMGRQGAVIIPKRFQHFFDLLSALARERPRLFPLVCFLYGSLSPLSNDFITIPAGIARISYVRMMIPLALGNIVFNVTLAYVALYAAGVLQYFIG
jgi:membrane protein YqaA with SNARE-associated domain